MCATLGIVFYLMYIVYIGGDFMLGRHFLLLLWISLFLMFMPVGGKQNIPFFCSVIILAFFYNFLHLDFVKQSYNDYAKENRPCWFADEQGYYYKHTGLIPVAHDYSQNGEVTIIKKEKNRGIQWFYNGKKYEYRLYDPLLVRLPAVHSEKWRTGHMIRKIPDGYKKTLNTGVNHIKDKDLALYYDKLKFILSGDLLDFERLKETVKFNNGAYDKYLRSYIEKHDPASPD